MSELAYIYLLQDGNDKGTSFYKIGRTVQQGGDSRKLQRLQSYSKGTVVHNTWNVSTSKVNDIEKKIKETFKEHYRLARGTEWFDGDVKLMKKDIDDIIETLDDGVCIACNGSGISYWSDDIYGECLECGGECQDKIIDGTHFTCVEDVLRCDEVSKEYKNRLMMCLKRVLDYYDKQNTEPIWGNCDIKYKDNTCIYKVHANKSLSFVQSIDAQQYFKIGFA